MMTKAMSIDHDLSRLDRIDGGPSHGVCDECRARKLKCSKERPGCSRCLQDGIRCQYSAKKVMGRPRKRRRGEIQEEQSVPTRSHDSISITQPKMFTEPELQNGDLMYLESLQVDFGQANSQLTELAQSSGFEDSVPSVGSLFNMDFPHYDHFSSPISDQLIQ